MAGQFTRNVFIKPFERATVASMEEELLIVQSATTSLMDGCSELDTAKRLTDISLAIEDILCVNQTVEKSTALDLLLLETTTRMAVAGSEVTVESILPSLESAEGMRYTAEGLTAFLEKLWKQIVEAVKKAWAAITDFFYKIFGTIPRMRSSLKELKKKVQARDNYDNWPTQLDMGTEVSVLMTDGKMPIRARDYEDIAGRVADQVEFYLRTYVRAAKDAYESVKDGMGEFDNYPPAEALNRLSNACQTLIATMAPPGAILTPARDRRFTDGEYLALPPLPSNRSVFIKRTEIPDAGKPLERAEAIKANYPIVQMTSYFQKDSAPKSYQFEAPSAMDVVSLCDIMLGICDIVEEFGRGNVFREMKKAKEELLATTNDLVSKSNSLEINDEKQLFYKAGIGFNFYLASSVMQPCAQLTGIAMNMNRVLLHLCEKAYSAA